MNGISEDGSILSGDALEKYAKKRGLCHVCASVVTHVPANTRFHLLSKRKWEPLTVPTDDGSGYLVYKGFCLQPTCYTLKQARQLLGEASDVSSSSFQISRRPSICETDWSERSFASGLGSMPDLYQSQQRSPILGKVKRSESLSYIKQGKVSFQACHSSYNNTVMSTQNSLSNSSVLGAKLIDFINNPLATTLDLSDIRLTSRSIPNVVAALGKTCSSSSRESCQKKRPPLKELVLNKCHLGRHTQRLDALMSGFIEKNIDEDIASLSLRNNNICKDGAACLAPLISGHNISVLDLSTNDLENEGVSTIMEAMLFVDTCGGQIEWNSCKIRRLNLSRNKIMDFSPITLQFFETTQTLQVLSLEGNFLRDAAISQLAKALIQNPQLALHDLLLGSNAFSDEGLISLSEFIQVSTHLKVLSVGKNNITSIGALVLQETLQTCNAPMEEVIGLEDNPLITDKTVVASVQKQLEILLKNRLFQSESHSLMSSSSSTCSSSLPPSSPQLSPSPSGSRTNSICPEKLNDVQDSQNTSNRKFVFTPEKPIVKNQIFQWIERNYSNVSSMVKSESDNDSITTKGTTDDDASQRSIFSLIDPSDHFVNFIGENRRDWTSEVCQIMSGKKSEDMKTTPDEEGFEVELPKILMRKCLDISSKTTNMPVVRQISSEDSTSSSARSNPSDHSTQGNGKVTDAECTSCWKFPSRGNEDERTQPLFSEEKKEDMSAETMFRTRSALELELRRCEVDIEAARHSDNPTLIRQGIQSQKRMQSLLPLRPGLPDRNQLETRVEQLEQKLQDPSSHHMLLEERLELASAKSLCISLLEEEYRLEAQLKVESS